MEKSFNVRTTDNGMFLVDWYDASENPNSCGGSSHTYAFATVAEALAFVESKFALVVETPAAPAEETPA